jgi:soluble lytic murein transglycosylase-like protein
MELPRRAWQAGTRSLGVFVRDVGRGMLEVSHNALALVGLAAVTVAAFTLAHPELRHDFEVAALGWLQDRHEERETATGNLLVTVADPTGVARATAAPVEALPREQAAVASWIARRYKVAPEPIAALVREAWSIGQHAGLDPTLILAIMAIESRFNPFAQSPVGAQGLMQVLTRVHDDKYDAFGGTHAAFDPISNLRVGVQVLKECIARAGSLHEGLRYYVGAALLEHDGGYISRVLSEQGHLRNVASGKRVPANVTNPAVRSAAPVAVRQAEPAESADAAERGAPRGHDSAPEAPAIDRVALLR